MKRSEMLTVLEIAISSETCETFSNDSLNRILMAIEATNIYNKWEYEDYEYIEPVLPTIIPLEYGWSDRTKTMIQRHNEGQTLQEIAKTFNVTRERIRQILAKALRKNDITSGSGNL